jgi:hypothetical protein
MEALGGWVEVREGQLQAAGDHTLFHKSWLPKHGAAPSAHLVYFAGVHESLELTAVERIVAAAVPRGTTMPCPLNAVPTLPADSLP